MAIYGKNDIRVISLMLQETGSFHDVYNRSFTMHLDDSVMDDLRGRIGNAGRENKLTSQAFRGLSSGILVPRTEVDMRRDRVIVPDGWDRPRCRFMMEVQVISNLGDDSTYYFQGFTDNLGLSHAGNIDHNMKFYINGFIRVQQIERTTRRGTETFGIVKQSAQVVNGELVYDEDLETHKMRTLDLYSNIQQRMHADAFDGGLDDDRTRFRNKFDSMFSQRKDNLPGEYLSDAIDNYRRSRDIVSFGVDQSDVIGRTHQSLSSELHAFNYNPVLAQLGRIQGQSSSTSFTINDILDLDPDASRTGVIAGTNLSKDAIRRLAHIDNDVSDWQASTVEAIWATQISNGVAAIMMNNYYRHLEVTIDNMNLDKRIIVDVLDSSAFADGVPREIFERMIDQVEDLLFDISHAGDDDFSVLIRANLYDQTEIFVSVQGEPEQRFFVPSFADSLMSPFYSRNADDLHSLSSDLESVIDTIGSDYNFNESLVPTSADDKF